MLPIAIAQIKPGNISEKLLNEIRQILYQAKEITKKVYKNIMNSIKVYNKVETIFMNLEDSKTFQSHRLYYCSIFWVK